MLLPLPERAVHMNDKIPQGNLLVDRITDRGACEWDPPAEPLDAPGR